MEVKSAIITDKISFREKIRISKRTVKEVKNLAPLFLPTTLFRQLLSVSEGYIGIYVSTMVLSGLEQKLPIRELIVKSMLLLSIIFVMEFAQAYQQQDSSTMNSALKGIVAGLMMAGISAVLTFLGF